MILGELRELPDAWKVFVIRLGMRPSIVSTPNPMDNHCTNG